MKKLLLLCAFSAIIGCMLSHAHAATIKLGNEGQLDIDIPPAWKSTVRQDSTDDGTEYIVDFTPGNNAKIHCQISLKSDTRLAPLREKDLRGLMQESADERARDYAEKKATLVPLNIKNGFGFSFTLTDDKPAGKTPAKNEYRVTTFFSRNTAEISWR